MLSLLKRVNGNPTAITSQSFEKETFRNSFKITNRLAAEIMPILQSDVQYQADLKDVLDILDGGGGYVDHLSTETYLSVMRSLQDPKRRFFIVPSQADKNFVFVSAR